MMLVVLVAACLLSTATSQLTEGSVRLVNGASDSEGRVEIVYQGAWGTVCDDGWGIEDANVVCRSLGFAGATEAVSFAEFGQGTGVIVLDDVSCSGTESSILECGNAGGLGVNNCGHTEDAGVRCENLQEGSVRLVDGASDSEGRVEIVYQGAWGTVCDDGWGIEDAEVVCRSLDFPGATEALSVAFFGQGTGDIVLDDVSCSGTESSLLDCGNAGLGNNNCGHHEDAGVRCAALEDGTLRLVDGTSDSEGRVEIAYNGEWGTVCDDGWDITDANVVCQSLGFPGATEALSVAFFGQGTGVIVLDDVSCSGTESSLLECGNAGLGINNCAHSEDAGVRCEAIPAGALRLVDGTSDSEGRVEILYQGEWGTVCDDGWDIEDANVVCRSLGFSGATEALSVAFFGQGTGVIVLDDVSCSGTESSLLECGNAGLGINNCAHSEDAGVRCAASGSVRLVDGTDSTEGRVEVFYNGAWGTVCDDLWDNTDAGVVCNMLGFGNMGMAQTNAYFGEGTGEIILDNVECDGSETSIFDCDSNGPGNHNCVHAEDAGVQCGGD